MEEVGLIKSQPKWYTPYQKTESIYTPDNNAWAWYGGSGISFKLTDDLSVDGLFAGRTTSSDNYGYMAEIRSDYTWAKLDTEMADISFGSQARFRYINCDGDKEQVRLTPVKFSVKPKSEYCPIDELYAYPAYATIVHDNKTSEDRTRFGALVGVSKNINANSSIYLECQVDTKDESFSDRNWSVNIGYKHTF